MQGVVDKHTHICVFYTENWCYLPFFFLLLEISAPKLCKNISFYYPLKDKHISHKKNKRSLNVFKMDTFYWNENISFLNE